MQRRDHLVLVGALHRHDAGEHHQGLVAFLAGERASSITGAVIDVAGGMGKYP